MLFPIQPEKGECVKRQKEFAEETRGEVPAAFPWRSRLLASTLACVETGEYGPERCDRHERIPEEDCRRGN